MFCERIRVKCLTAWRELPDAYEDVETNKLYAKNRVVLQTDDKIFATVKHIAGVDASAFVREAIDRYSYVTHLVANAVTSKTRGDEPLIQPTVSYTNTEFDRVLNVMQSMGQWAWGYCAILDLLGVSELNAKNIAWDGFPHLSRIGVYHGGRIIWLGGAARQVLEYWFIAHGGYHSQHEIYVSDRAEYERACLTVANPWALANVTRLQTPIEAHWLPAAVAPVVSVREDDLVSTDRVVYRVNDSGRVLPLGFGDRDTGNRPAQEAWQLTERAELLGRMGVPFQLREKVLHAR